MTSLTSEGFFHDLWEFGNTGGVSIVPFLQFERQSIDLDRYYYWTQSGDKTVSKVLNMNLTDDGVLSSETRAYIVRAFWETHGRTLIRQWENFIVEYEPQYPYDVHEETDYTHENTGTVEDDGTVTVEKSGKEKTSSGQDITHDYVNGFDDNSAGGTSSGMETYDKGAVTLEYGSDNTRRTDTRTLDTTKTSRDNSTDELETHKYGTLGTVAMGEIMSKEFDTWMWSFFTKCLFPLVDSMLTIPLYESI